MSPEREREREDVIRFIRRRCDEHLGKGHGRTDRAIAAALDWLADDIRSCKHLERDRQEVVAEIVESVARDKDGLP